MTAKVFEAALGIAEPWAVAGVEFDELAKTLTVVIDFKRGSRFEVSGHAGRHPVHDTVTKTYRHLNFFQHECRLQVRTPRVKLPNGSVRLIEPDFAGRLSGFTLLFEALILMALLNFEWVNLVFGGLLRHLALHERGDGSCPEPSRLAGGRYAGEQAFMRLADDWGARHSWPQRLFVRPRYRCPSPCPS